MKSLMLKLSTILLLSSSLIHAKTLDEKVLSFLSSSIHTTKAYKLKDVNVIAKKDIKNMPKWKVYFIKITLDLLGKNKDIIIRDRIFTNGKVISKDFIDINSKRSIKNNFVLDLDSNIYKKSHLIEGNFNAKYKLVVFSDPLCPFCMSFLPDVINFVKMNPKEFGLFYYHFPLNIHPNSKTFVKAMIVAEKNGEKDIQERVYNETFESGKKDEKLALTTFNKALNTSITLEQINKKDIIDKMEADLKIAKNHMISGTPALFINGVFDKHRELFTKLRDKN